MPPFINYDAVVLGSSPAGLMTAGLLRRAGYQVLVLGQGAAAPRYRVEGIELLAMPAWLPPYGFSRQLDGVLQQLGAEDPVHRLGGQPARLQLITPQERLDLFPEREKLAAELERARLPERDEVLRILARLEQQRRRTEEMLLLATGPPRRGLLAEARWRRSAQELERSAERPEGWPWLLRVLAAARLFFCHQEPAQQPAWACGHWVLQLLGGLRQVDDLPGVLLEAIRRAGCVLQPDQSAASVSDTGKDFVLSQAEAVYRCRCLVSGLRLEQTAELISLGRLRRRFQNAQAAVRRNAALFVVSLVLPARAIPQGMSEAVLLVPRPQQPLAEDNLVLLCRRPLAARKDREQVLLFCRLAAEKRSAGRAALAPLQKSLGEIAALVIPFLRESLEVLSSPFWEGRGGDEPHPDPWGLHPIFEIEGSFSTGFSEALLRSLPRRLYPAGPELSPVLGVEGAALLAKVLAQRVARDLGRRVNFS